MAKEAVHVYLWEGFLVKEVEEYKDARFFLEGVAALRHSFNLVSCFFFISFFFCRILLILESYTSSQEVGVSAESLYSPRSTPW